MGHYQRLRVPQNMDIDIEMKTKSRHVIEIYEHVFEKYLDRCLHFI